MRKCARPSCARWVCIERCMPAHQDTDTRLCHMCDGLAGWEVYQREEFDGPDEPPRADIDALAGMEVEEAFGTAKEEAPVLRASDVVAGIKPGAETKKQCWDVAKLPKVYAEIRMVRTMKLAVEHRKEALRLAASKMGVNPINHLSFPGSTMVLEVCGKLSIFLESALHCTSASRSMKTAPVWWQGRGQRS